ncbi:hypothetical protein AUJ66_07330 [Candidatus Desantisbacteria bacterium CG1_02_38_46]|uniref:MBL fold metallo-hydrolase n=2 Tax=unclassified Candidatus Desantisiibacteriota TaxID=3106372 RepID=A0A2H9PA55_9BACT|nr:MAG: hypothetical protein AUJ66_07330 [Candidatus Desantisbacteria bacterium CG1_02_38_46]PIZ15227.1 MAG: MBL fold metallo-hydrolase [Candidatus Desantisbacteria bacterium CG_4_10_14_0_8_um_filter_39_17]
MKIKFWGCRGSIPVPDSRMMKYGGNTTCVEVIFENRIFIIDAGTGIRKLGDSLIKRKVSNIDMFITHSHWDHILGFPFFKPIYSGNTLINIFGRTSSYKRLKDIFTSQMSYEYFPVSFSELKSKINFTELSRQQYDFDGHIIKIIQTNHPIFAMGIRIEKGDKSFVFITDNELGLENPRTSRGEFIAFCKNATYLIHDAQFTEEEYKTRQGWGHSTFMQAIMLADDSDIKNLGFFHHDPDRKDDELEEIEAKYKKLCESKRYRFNLFAVRELKSIVI